MVSPSEVRTRAVDAVHRARERWGWFDHAVATVQHYQRTQGDNLAAASTYFGFLSFFPLVALAFFAVGIIARVYPEAEDALITLLNQALPGIVGDEPGQVPFSVFTDNAGKVGVIGLVGIIYAGTGWMAGLRSALAAVFEVPQPERFGFVAGRTRDLATMVLVGTALLVSVSLSGVVSALSADVLDLIGLSGTAAFVVLWLIGHGLAIAASTVVLLVIFRLLAPPHLPRRSMLEGALLGAVGFEVLKAVAWFLLEFTRESAAFAALGVSLVLVVWINYFCRLLLLAASWGATAPSTLEDAQPEASYA